MNIKNPETERLARELAKSTGESLTAAITVALKERLERQKANPKAGLAAWLEELSRETAPLMKSPRSNEVFDKPYDQEMGLPG
jgi:antitoxin VapB